MDTRILIVGLFVIILAQKDGFVVNVINKNLDIF